MQIRESNNQHINKLKQSERLKLPKRLFMKSLFGDFFYNAYCV